MSLESAIADLVSASTQLTQSVNVTRATVEATRDTVIAQEAPVTTAKDATTASATAATTDTATTASKLTAAAADYATQKTTKGLAAVQTSADSELKDRLHRRDPARHPFRGARPSLVMDFVRRECHRNNAAGNLEPVDLNTFMTFTRGSTATYVGPDGLIKEAAVNTPRYGYDPVTGEALGLLVEEQRTNLLGYSDGYAPGGTWSRGAGCIAQQSCALSPDGKSTAFRATSTMGSLSYFSLVAGVLAAGTYTLSFYAKKESLTKVFIEAFQSVATDFFNLTTGVAVTQGGSTYSMQAVGGGWFRCVATKTFASATTLPGAVYLNAYGGADAAESALFWGFQLEAGAFPTSYIPTPATFTGRASTKTYFDSNGVMQTAASGVAATDYGYVDGRWISKGLSLEGQATNLLIQSQDFTGYGVNGTIAPTVSRGTVLSPTGVLSCADVTFAAGAGNTDGVFKHSIAGTLGTTYTASVFLKAGVGSVFRMSIEGSVIFGGTSIVDFDQVTGSVSFQSTVGAPVTIRVTQFGAWYRISLTRTAVADGNMAVCFYSGVTIANRFVIYGAQLETGPVATSYIQTTTAQVTRAADTSTSAQVTRAADNAVSTQAAALYNLDAGTTCVEAKYSNRGTYPGLYSWDYDYFIFNAAIFNALILNGRGSAGTMGLTPPAVDTTLRHAVRRNRLNLKSAVNNSALTGTSLSLSPTTTVTMLRLGIGTEYWNGYIRQLTYFPRQLSDADLQALTILED